MTAPDAIYLIVFFAIILAAAKPLGEFMAAVYSGERTFLSPAIGPVERGIYRAAGVRPEREQDWRGYTVAMLGFNFLGFVMLYLLLRLQGHLPLNPQDLPGLSPHLAFNTAVSFVSNTNWQSYGGETTMSYLSQMLGLTFQNFVSAATGMAILAALARGFSRHSASTIGNFWVDLVRGTLYVLLPLSVIWAIFFMSQGVIQNFDSYREVTTLEGAKQVFALGPAASQIAIKQLGTNGGGFFNVNSAHPFENPTALSNFASYVAIILIPAAMVLMYGRMVGAMKHAWIVLGVMTGFLLIGSVITTVAEQNGTRSLRDAGIELSAGNGQPGGNMEGKEVRFGIGPSADWAVATSAASNGSVNSMHDSYTPIGGLVPMANIATGEVIFGGVGSGMYGMVLYIVLAVFIAGLMVGRTPEYLGKKVEAREVKAVMVAFLSFAAIILGLAGVAAVNAFGTGRLNNGGPHGLSEILYAFISGGGNNGSAFAGLGANTEFYNSAIGVAMLVGRYLYIIPVLLIAGTMAAKRRVPASAGTFPTDGLLFGGLLSSVIVVVGLLTFFPAFSLGPIVEQFLSRNGSLI